MAIGDVGIYFLNALDAQARLLTASLSVRPPKRRRLCARRSPPKCSFRMKGFSLYVEVKLNGKGPYWIILDTGAASTWIDAQIAKEAGAGENPPTATITA